MARPVACSTAFLASLLLAGCASSPATHFYTLSAPAAAGNAPTSQAAQATYNIAVGPVRIPDMVDRPQFVIRQGGNRVDLVEQHRWAQPLRSEIAQALAADLGRQLPQARVFLYNDAAAPNPDCRVVMDIERFDATLGEAVTVQGLWRVSCTAPAATRTGRSTVREAAQGGGFDALAAAYGRALSGIGMEIARAIAALT